MNISSSLYSINRLRNDYGMRPKPNTTPAQLWTHYPSGHKYPVYRLDDCQAIPGLKIIDNPISDQTRQSIEDLFETDFVVLDTETTGLADHDQLIELAIVDKQGQTLHDARYLPTVRVTWSATQVHGITEFMLKDKPTFAEDAELIKSLLIGKTVVIFNAEYDVKILRNSFKAFGLDASFLDELKTYCAMRAAAKAYGATNQYGSISLSNALQEAGGNWQNFKAHSALGDCLATLHVLKDIYGQNN